MLAASESTSSENGVSKRPLNDYTAFVPDAKGEPDAGPIFRPPRQETPRAAKRSARERVAACDRVEPTLERGNRRRRPLNPTQLEEFNVFRQLADQRAEIFDASVGT